MATAPPTMYDEDLAFRVENIRRAVGSSLGSTFEHDHPDAMARIIAATLQADAMGRLTDAISHAATEMSAAISSLTPD